MASKRYELGVGCLLLVAMGVLAWMALQVGSLRALGPSMAAEARFANAAGLQVGAVVAIAGVPVGTVESLRIDHDHAIVTFSLDPAAQIRQDARVAIRSRSVLGEKYLELSPRSTDAPLLADGGTLAVGAEQVEIDQMVNLMGPLIGAIDPAAMSAAGTALGKALEEDPERLARMLRDAEELLRNTAEASRDLPPLAKEARTTLTEGRATLAQARQAVSALEARAADAKVLLDRAYASLDKLDAASEPLPELVADAKAAVADARSAMAKVDAAMADVETITENLSEIDKWELRRLLREEGILVRLRPREVDPVDDQPFRRRGSVK